MSRHVVKLPDLGEGTVSSEIVAWRVKVGDYVEEDQPMVEMSTDKAVVEMPAPVSGRVVSLAGEPGDQIAVGAELIVIETDAGAAASSGAEPAAKKSEQSAPAEKPAQAAPAAAPAPAAEKREPTQAPAAARKGRVMASPATRRLARESGIDLATIAGTGRDGRIRRQDLEAAISARGQGKAPAAPASRRAPRTEVEEIRILGVRRVSAQRVAESKRNIPHFSYVEEVDMTELERLRRHLNSKLPKGTPGYTYLPFLALALVRVLERFPKANSLYDAERNVLLQHRGVHVGIATQTSDGLKVPVVRHVESMTLREVAAEIRRVTEAARNGTASRNELKGSTITITSLGRLGGIVSTPIINAPEVAIIGVNKAVERPVIHNGQVAVRLMMNLSSSFDHRFIDGYDAAEMIQALKECLEQPATIFIED
ncbi:MAG TPA: dihydrolipoamide acetyltransferase family protein [Steroidobacter sp.]